MKIVMFDEYRLGILDGDAVVDVSMAVNSQFRGTAYAMNEFIREFEKIGPTLESLIGGGDRYPVATVKLGAPIPSPWHLFAAPLNYPAHIDEMAGSKIVGSAFQQRSARELGFFLKPMGSICGPQDAIRLPDLPGRTFHHEIELGAVIGRRAAGLSDGQGAGVVFGYTCLVDVTLRATEEHSEERVMRKSFETFTPIGPAIVTSDEIPDPASLRLQLWVNEELRQDASAADMVVQVDELIERASNVLPLQPGDVYATGTPSGVGPIKVGDEVRAKIDGVGEMTLPVVRRKW